MTPTVWVTNANKQDINHARTFGNVKIITKGLIKTFKVDELSKMMNQALKQSKPHDYIVPTGHQFLGLLASIEMLRRHKRLNLLLWHAKEQIYVPRFLEINLGAEDDEAFIQEALAGK